MSTSPAAWHPDPTGRHHLRYFDGNKWTDHVTTQSGVQAVDPVQPVATQPLAASSPSTPPPLQVSAAAQQPPTLAAASGAAPKASIHVTKAAIVAGVAAVAALIGSLSMNWMTGSAGAVGSGEHVSLSIDRSLLSLAFDHATSCTPALGCDPTTNVPHADLYGPFVSWGWILAPIVCALAALLSLGYARKARVWTIALALLTTLWAIGTAYDLSIRTNTVDGATSITGTSDPAAGLFVVIAASAVAFIIAIMARKSTVPPRSPAVPSS